MSEQRIRRVLLRSAADDPDLEKALAELGALERRLEQAEAERDSYIRKTKKLLTDARA